MLAFKLMDLLYLDGYRNLWDKFHDPNRNSLRQERHWAYDNYKTYMNAMFQEHAFGYMKEMRRAKRAGDYVMLYNIMLDFDGDLDNQIIV